MKRTGAFYFLILLALTTVVVPAVAAQESPVQVLSNTADYTFSENLTFGLTAESETEIAEVLLLYQSGIEGTQNRRNPDFQPGTRVEVEFVERLDRGQIPPGTTVEYHWEVKTQDGETFETEPRSFTYMDDRFDWRQVSQGKVTVFWYGADEGFGQRILERSVAALNRLKDNVGVDIEQQVKVIVYQSKADMQKALIYRGDTYEEQIITLGTVVAPNIMLLHGTHSGVDQTIAHELSHVVVGLATENPFGDIPAWLNEGLAMYNEGELRGSNRAALDRAIERNNLISVRSLTAPTGDPSKVNLWYGEAFSVVDFLLEEYGGDKMEQLLDVFSEGATYDGALREVYGFDQDELDARWREWLGAPARQTPTSPEDLSETESATPQAGAESQPEPAPTAGVETQQGAPRGILQTCLSLCTAPLTLLLALAARRFGLG